MKNGVAKKLEKKIEELKEAGQIEKAGEYETSFKVIMDILDEIVLVLGEKNVSFDKYADILAYLCKIFG